jgi:flagellar biosynthesis protein FliR
VLQEHFVAFSYLAVRLAPITLIAPLFFFTHIPLLVRTVFTLMLTLIIGFGLDDEYVKLMGSNLNFLTLIGEFLIGMVLALGFHAVNAAIHMMSQLIDVQIGISAGATFDPQNHQTSSPTSTLLSMVAVAIFFSTNLHYDFFLGLSQVFRLIPVGTGIALTTDYILALGKIFVIAFVLAGPVIITLFLTDVALALISRSMPQAQVYFVALPLKLMVGFVMLALVLKLSQPYFYEILSSGFVSWDQLSTK